MPLPSPPQGKFAGPCPGRVRSWPLNLKSNKKHKQQQSNWSNDSAIVGVFVELLNCCCLLFNCCLLFKQSLTLGGAVWEPWATTIVPCFTFGGTFFSVGFLALTFSTKTHICHQTGSQNDSQIHPKPGPGPIRCWFPAPSVFDGLRSVFNRFYCFRLFKNTQQTKQKQSLEKTMNTHINFM